MKILKITLLPFLFLFQNNPIYPTNYFVSNSGDNSNTGLNLPNAFETIQFAADLVVAGDTVFVENGTYIGF